MSSVTAIRPAATAAGAGAPPQGGVTTTSSSSLPPRSTAWAFNETQLEAALSLSFDSIEAVDIAKQIVRDFLHSPAAKKLRIGGQP